MPSYAYTGLDGRGKTIKGVASADNVGSLKATLKRSGVFLTGVSETAGVAVGSEGSREIDFERFFDRVSPKMIAAVTRLLSTLLAAGVTLPESLAALTEQVESARFKAVLNDIAERVNQGSALADALSKHPGVFEDLYINMVRAGEASGALEVVLLRLAEFMERQQEMRGKILSALMYPLVLTVLAVVIVIVLMVGVVPKITSMFEGMNVDLPWNTKLLIFTSDVFAGYWYLVLGFTAASVWLFRRWRRSASGRERGDRLLLRMPIIGDLVRKIAIARFARTLSTMLASGVQLLHALDIVRSLLGNVVLEQVIRTAHDNIREGEGIAPALKRSGEFPPLVTHMVAVGERSGQLEQMLNDVAGVYERESNTAITRMTGLLEPIMIVLMGLAVGFVLFSIMRPIMMMNEMAGQ